MRTVRIGLILMVLGLGACAPSANTGDPEVDAIIDLVVSREAPFHQCFEVTTKGGLVAEFPEDYNAPQNGGWDINLLFENPQVVDAASKVAVSLDEAVRMENETKVLHLFGEHDQNSARCVMSLSYPTFSNDFAFLSFMNPGGEFGQYALERDGSNWSVKERVFTGRW